MRSKVDALAQALTGHFNDHHAFLAHMICQHIDILNAMVTELDQRIDLEIAPYRREVELLDSVDGIDVRGAQIIVAEIGVDMHRFTSAAHLASWAGVCPGNNKTGGKARTTHTRPGNHWLKAVFGVAAMAAIRKRHSYAGALYRRIAGRRGGMRALVAVGHSLLQAIWHILSTGEPYRDLGDDYYLNRTNPDRRRRNAIAQLERLGLRVTVEPINP
jgi:transposase